MLQEIMKAEMIMVDGGSYLRDAMVSAGGYIGAAVGFAAGSSSKDVRKAFASAVVGAGVGGAAGGAAYDVSSMKLESTLQAASARGPATGIYCPAGSR